MTDSNLPSAADAHPSLDTRRGSNVLFACPPVRGRHACSDLLSTLGRANCDVLEVSLRRPSDERAFWWAGSIGGPPARHAVVTTDDRIDETGPGVGPPSLRDATVETVADPADLPAVGVRTSKLLEEWEETSERTVVCFDSITAVLDRAGPEATFRFLHLLTARCERAGAFAHYHLDPAAHDEATANALAELFDAVVEVPDGGPGATPGRMSP